MARQEEEKEDLLREATALVERAEIRGAAFAEPVVVGFRRDGCASVFFGGDPVFQFNTRGELRRAFVDGSLLKAVGRTLACLTKKRSATETVLLRHDLTADETAAVLSLGGKLLGRLAEQLAGEFTATEVPADGGVIRRIRRWLAEQPAEMRIAAAPNAR